MQTGGGMKSEGFVLWLDILGFKAFLCDESRSLRAWPQIEHHLYENLNRVSKKLKGNGVHITFNVISDTIVISTTKISSKALFFLSAIGILLQSDLLASGFLSRGVISVGKIYTSHKKNMNTIIGKPIAEAATYEPDLASPIIIAAPSLVNLINNNPDVIKDVFDIATLEGNFFGDDLFIQAIVEFKTHGKFHTYINMIPGVYDHSLNAYLDHFRACSPDFYREDFPKALRKLFDLKHVLEENQIDEFSNLQSFLKNFEDPDLLRRLNKVLDKKTPTVDSKS